jgi:hypothetical protein
MVSPSSKEGKRVTAKNRNPWKYLVGTPGFEPGTLACPHGLYQNLS